MTSCKSCAGSVLEWWWKNWRYPMVVHILLHPTPPSSPSPSPQTILIFKVFFYYYYGTLPPGPSSPSFSFFLQQSELKSCLKPCHRRKEGRKEGRKGLHRRKKGTKNLSFLVCACARKILSFVQKVLTDFFFLRRHRLKVESCQGGKSLSFAEKKVGDVNRLSQKKKSLLAQMFRRCWKVRLEKGIFLKEKHFFSKQPPTNFQRDFFLFRKKETFL